MAIDSSLKSIDKHDPLPIAQWSRTTGDGPIDGSN